MVQLDLESLAQVYEVSSCEENTRFAGTAFSQFVDLQGGTLWRADFHLMLKPKAMGAVQLALDTTLSEPDQARYRIDIQATPFRCVACAWVCTCRLAAGTFRVPAV